MAYEAKRTDGTDGAVLVFTFHGTGGDETQFHGLAEKLMPDAHVVSPRGDVMEGTLRRYFKRAGEGVYDMDDLAQRSKAMADFMADDASRVSPSEVIGLGYSNGANILASAAFMDASIVDRFILMHPLIPFEPEPQPGLGGRQVLITAGRRDPICPADKTEALAEWLRAQGAVVEVAWHDGGHEIRQSEIDAIQSFLAN